MPNLYQPGKRTIGNFLSTTSPTIVVPEWQRSYSWTTTQIDAFWEDLVAFSKHYPGDLIVREEYFLGSIVVVESGDEHLLLDGQQRVSTAAILLSVVRDNLKFYDANAATRTQARYLGDYDDARGQYEYKISMNRYDRDYFKRMVLEERDDRYSEPPATIESHELISRARKLFLNRFSEERSNIENPKNFHDWVLRIQNVVTNHMSVVAVFSDDEDNASAVFETLNDRGIGLSTPDLVKNLVLRRAREGVRDEIIELWGEILQIGNDTALKTFLRHYWISHYGDVKTQSLYREMKSKILGDDMNSLELSRNLRDAAMIYGDIASGTWDTPRIDALLSDAAELGATILYPVVLSGLQVLDESNGEVLIGALIDSFVRHSIVAGLENSRLENVTYRMAREIRAGRDLAEMLLELRAFCPSDTDFSAKFSILSVKRRASARYLLKRIESDLRMTEEIEIAPPDKVHIEHIYPQTPPDGARWTNHGEIVDRLGNLTLLSARLNQSLRNSDFDTKKVRYEDSELLQTKSLAQVSDWSTQQINDRQTAFAQRAPELWPVVIEPRT